MLSPPPHIPKGHGQGRETGQAPFAQPPETLAVFRVPSSLQRPHIHISFCMTVHCQMFHFPLTKSEAEKAFVLLETFRNCLKSKTKQKSHPLWDEKCFCPPVVETWLFFPSTMTSGIHRQGQGRRVFLQPRVLHLGGQNWGPWCGPTSYKTCLFPGQSSGHLGIHRRASKFSSSYRWTSSFCWLSCIDSETIAFFQRQSHLGLLWLLNLWFLRNFPHLYTLIFSWPGVTCSKFHLRVYH